MSQESVEAIGDVWRAVNMGDLDALIALVTDDFCFRPRRFVTPSRAAVTSLRYPSPRYGPVIGSSAAGHHSMPG